MATNKPVSERVQHATGSCCRRRAASEDLKKIGFYKHSAPTEPIRRIRGSGETQALSHPVLTGGARGSVVFSSGRSEMFVARQRTNPSRSVCDTRQGSVGGKPLASVRRILRSGATAMFDPYRVGVNSGSYPRVAACRPYPRLYSLSPSGTSEEWRHHEILR